MGERQRMQERDKMRERQNEREKNNGGERERETEREKEIYSYVTHFMYRHMINMVQSTQMKSSKRVTSHEQRPASHQSYLDICNALHA